MLGIVLLITVIPPIAGIVAFRSGALKKPKAGEALLCAFPCLLWILMYYSLAMHMYQSLGAWPEVIGTQGFPAALLRHSDLTMMGFTVLFFFSLFVWPVAFAVTAWVERWRRYAARLAIYAISYSAVWLLMFVTPSEFRNWWWD